MILGTFTQYTGFNHRRNPEKVPRPQTVRVTARRSAEEIQDYLAEIRISDDTAYWDDLLNGVGYKKGAV